MLTVPKRWLWPIRAVSSWPDRASNSDRGRAVQWIALFFVLPRYVVLGTDGFGRTDTREALRHVVV